MRLIEEKVVLDIQGIRHKFREFTLSLIHRNFHFKGLSHKKIYVGSVSQTGLAGIVVYDTIVIAKVTYLPE